MGKEQLGDFFIGKTIGEGAFSKVKLGHHKETGQKVAIKIIDKRMIAAIAAKAKIQEERKRLEAEYKKKGKPMKEPVVEVSSEVAQPSYLAVIQLEVQLLMRLDHPNVIKLHQMVETDDECYVVMEYASGGELINYIANKGHLSEKEARNFFRQMVSALDHCHTANVVHRDLKLENLLLSENRSLLISDFGLGRVFKEDQLLRTFCGTPNYELVSGIPYEGPKSDIWSMGVVLYIMMTGQPPFKGESISVLYNKIKSASYERPSYFSQPLINLLNKILVQNPAGRADMEQIRLDEWVNIDEEEPPQKINPRQSGTLESGDLAKNIQGMSAHNGVIVYNFVPLTRKSENKNRWSSNVINKSYSDSTNSSTQVSPASPTSPSLASFPGEVSLGPSARRGSRVFAPQDIRSKRRGSDFPISPSAPSSPSKNDVSFGTVQSHSKFGMNDTLKSTELTKSNSHTKSFTMTQPTQIKANTRYTDSEVVSPRGRSQSIQVTSFAKPKFSPHPSPPASKAPLTPTRQRPIDADLISHNSSDSFEATPNSQAISDAEIYEWHTIHKPPKEIRTIKWSFNGKMTSHLPPAIMFQHLHRALDELNLEFYGNITYRRVPDYYIFDCEYQVPNGGGLVAFEVEVSKVWLLKVHGIKVKRCKGDSLVFKEVISSLTELMHF